MAQKGQTAINRDTLIMLTVKLTNCCTDAFALTESMRRGCEDATEALHGGDGDAFIEQFLQISRAASNIYNDIYSLKCQLDKAHEKINDTDRSNSSASAATMDATDKVTRESKLSKE